MIASPLDGSILKPGKVTVRVVAWAGEANIAKVEISTDGGATWKLASLGKEQAHYAWRLWHHDFTAKIG